MNLSEIYDNPVISVNGESKDRLITAMSLALKSPAVGWAIDTNPHRMVFFWTNPNKDGTVMNPGFNPFPTPIDTNRMAEYAWDWLRALPKDAWTPTDDPEIWLGYGWRVYVDTWNGRIKDHGWQSFIAVQPYSLWIGK